MIYIYIYIHIYIIIYIYIYLQMDHINQTQLKHTKTIYINPRFSWSVVSPLGAPLPAPLESARAPPRGDSAPPNLRRMHQKTAKRAPISARWPVMSRWCDVATKGEAWNIYILWICIYIYVYYIYFIYMSYIYIDMLYIYTYIYIYMEQICKTHMKQQS